MEGCLMTDILDREPIYDFAQFRDFCELVGLKAACVELGFLIWLYSEANV